MDLGRIRSTCSSTGLLFLGASWIGCCYRKRIQHRSRYLPQQVWAKHALVASRLISLAQASASFYSTYSGTFLADIAHIKMESLRPRIRIGTVKDDGYIVIDSRLRNANVVHFASLIENPERYPFIVRSCIFIS